MARDTDSDPTALGACFAALRDVQRERAAAARLAIPALRRLVATFPHRTGQSYKLRSLLWSLYNGRPADLSDMLCLDWTLRKDLAAVMLGFGHEDKTVRFFYAAFDEAINVEAHQWDWFAAAGDEPGDEPDTDATIVAANSRPAMLALCHCVVEMCDEWTANNRDPELMPFANCPLDEIAELRRKAAALLS